MNNTGKIRPSRSLKFRRGETYTKGDTSKYIITGWETVCKEQGAGRGVAPSRYEVKARGWERAWPEKCPLRPKGAPWRVSLESSRQISFSPVGSVGDRAGCSDGLEGGLEGAWGERVV